MLLMSVNKEEECADFHHIQANASDFVWMWFFIELLTLDG